MSGHSKWATIKRKKGAVDAKRGKIFTKVVREITTAARMGGGDPNGNPRLRAAILAAKAARMPADNIERAIKKGTGAWDGPPVEETAYEAYAPGGVALYIEAQTDNKNRTTGEVRTVLTKANSALGASGSVAWMFHKKGRFVFDAGKYTEEELTDAAIEAGAEDVTREGDTFVVLCELRAFSAVAEYFEKHNLKVEEGELTMVPESYVKVKGEDAEKLMGLMERLEDLDDVQKVHANFDIDDADLERIAGAS
ncbi:MAG: YebC/PmpR family DNA-binding transcriptional regulator [Deltaproteobacteria bacterium]|nr:YebC/PmpR family DNA-binding transcriptional regulator [Deltaproteobacteria bacterium]